MSTSHAGPHPPWLTCRPLEFLLQPTEKKNGQVHPPRKIPFGKTDSAFDLGEELSPTPAAFALLVVDLVGVSVQRAGKFGDVATANLSSPSFIRPRFSLDCTLVVLAPLLMRFFSHPLLFATIFVLIRSWPVYLSSLSTYPVHATRCPPFA